MSTNDFCEYVTVTVGDQRLGIPVLRVQDVLRAQPLTRIPLAPREIAGSLNLRGRIVTAVDVRVRLGLPPREKGAAFMNVVVEQENELYSLMVDSVGDVLGLTSETYEANPVTLDPIWREVSDGLHRLEDGLLVILDVDRILALVAAEAA